MKERMNVWTRATEDWESGTGIVIYIQPFIDSCLHLCPPIAIPTLSLLLTWLTLSRCTEQ